MKTLGITILAIIGLVVALPIALGILGAVVGLAVRLLMLALVIGIPTLLVIWLVRALTRDRDAVEVAEPAPDHVGPHAGRLRRIDYRLRRLEDILLSRTR